eukprot:GDKJ01038653.1.p1 GENE.GDKJ01038653.1~~GDKJ01038653.1.p1  ORF type:complete len:236 (+),score=-41.90 GDKJ01038653.1:174-881(+)
MFRTITVLAILMLVHVSANAQMDVGIGPSFGFPMSFNPNVGNYHHSSGVPGAKLQLTYLPENATFVPTLAVETAPYILPITMLGNTDRVLNMHFFTLNAMLYGRVHKVLNNNKELFYGIGIGAAYMKGTGVGLSGNKNSYITEIEDSADYIQTISPQVGLSIEYVIPVTPKLPLYLGIGGQVLYSYYFERQTNWRISVVDDQYNLYNLRPKLQGHMLNPGVYLTVYYRLGAERKY